MKLIFYHLEKLLVRIIQSFFGTDSAPHHIDTKSKMIHLKPGIFSSSMFIGVICFTIFEEENALDNLEKFSSINGPNFIIFQIILMII